jgi:ABC-2 type transport system permease protein
MRAIFKKEILSFFTNPVGYLIISLFILLNGLFLWVFKGDFNVFDYGFANLSLFFLLTPWVFLFIIPAITMKSFSEEKKTGTLELLMIKPIGKYQLVGGKFLGAFFLVILALIPTLFYVLTISNLGISNGNYDTGLVIGSYIGLTFLVMSYTAIGIFSSTLTSNQIVAFILALVMSFIFYYGFEALSTIFDGNALQFYLNNLGMKSHFEGIALGVIKIQDVVYFLSITLLFLFLSKIQLQEHQK